MRKFFRNAKKSPNSNPKSDIISIRPRRAVTVICELTTLFMILCLALPLGCNWLQQNWNLQLASVAQAARLDASANRQEHLCMQISLYWEMKHKRVKDAVGIAGNIMNRVDLPEYPDSVCEVVNEIRRNRGGGNTAMYSYIFDGRYIPKYNDAEWVSAGIVGENVMLAHDEGRPFIRSVNYLTEEAFKRTEWAFNWKKHCEIKPIEIEGAYHIFFDKLTKSERKACLAANKKGGKSMPIPTPRPAHDEIASLIQSAS